MSLNMIHISHLTKAYGQRKGVFDITLEVKAGEVYGMGFSQKILTGSGYAGSFVLMAAAACFCMPSAPSILPRRTYHCK